MDLTGSASAKGWEDSHLIIMKYSFTIEIPDKRGQRPATHKDFLKAAYKQFDETLEYATSVSGKRLMNKLKEKANCSELELVQECWEATHEELGKKSNAVIEEKKPEKPKQSSLFSRWYLTGLYS